LIDACRPNCRRRIGQVAPAGMTHAPVGPKSHPTKLARSFICAVVKPFDADGWALLPVLIVRVVVSISQYTSDARPRPTASDRQRNEQWMAHVACPIATLAPWRTPHLIER
jgi:hypothetical protein